ncbi:MAG: alpha/beta hydrolase family protein [Myxococcota bacterium]
MGERRTGRDERASWLRWLPELRALDLRPDLAALARLGDLRRLSSLGGLGDGAGVARWLDEWNRLVAHPGGIDVPIAPPHPLVAAKLVADEAYLLARAPLVSSLGPAVDFVGAEAEIAAALELFARRGWLDDPRSFHRHTAGDAGSPPPAAPRARREWSAVGRFDHLRFVSGYAPDPDVPGRARWLAQRANREAHAWAVRSASDTRRWLVCIPGWGMGSPSLDLSAFAADALHAAHGLNVLLYVPPLHGPRRAGWRSGDGLFDASPLAFVHASAQAVWELRRLVAWLRAEGAERVGVFGLSLGASFAALLASVEPGLDCVVAGMPATDVAPRYASYCDGVARKTGEAPSDVRARAERLLRVAAPTAVAPLVPRERRYVFAGVVDRVVRPADVLALWRHWERPRIAWYPGGHVSYATEPKVRALLARAWDEAGLARPARRARGSRASTRRSAAGAAAGSTARAPRSRRSP